MLVLVACLSLGAAPLPRERPVSESELGGVWHCSRYGVDGVTWYAPPSANRSVRGMWANGYAGVWWMDRGRVVLIEYPVDGWGLQAGPAFTYEFEIRRTATGYALSGSFDLTLTRGP